MMRILFSFVAAVGVTVGVGALLSGVPGSERPRACFHGGKVYPPGHEVATEGRTLACHGETGTWVEPGAPADATPLTKG